MTHAYLICLLYYNDDVKARKWTVEWYVEGVRVDDVTS